MSCGFCAVTPVAVCPVCTAAPVPFKRQRKGSARPVAAFKAPTPAITPPPVRSAPQQAARTVVYGLPVPTRGVMVVDAAQLKQAVADNVARRAAVTQPARPSAMPQPASESLVDRVANAIRAAWTAGQVNIALGLAIGLANPELREIRLQVLRMIDENAQRRGFMLSTDEATRASISNEVYGEIFESHGFDPRQPRKAAAPIARTAEEPSRAWEHPAVQALPSGVLQGGDWAELARRVKDGRLSHDDALKIGAEWMKVRA